MAKFLKSASNETHFYTDRTPEICFIGRSNVGKSSLINALAASNIAKTSNTPGRTQLINFFQFDHFRLVDLPGYGFAKVNKQKKDELTRIIETYLTKSPNLIAVFQLVDINVITDIDQEMSRFFQHQNYLHYVILNKIDKTNKSYFDNNKIKIAKALNVSLDQLIYCSTKTKVNIDLIKKVMKKVALDWRVKEEKKEEGEGKQWRRNTTTNRWV
nr:ribosome biogenesis GTP-binding protein YihA/YsxC [Ureaplasma canigenitalium]